MRIDELTGVKKYRERDLWDVIRDYIAAGGEWLGNGRYANVIGFPNRDHVWKFFPSDSCYIAFVRWAMRNPAPYLPRFLSKPKWIVPFYRRPKTEAKLCVVKMERLSEWKLPYLPEAGQLSLMTFFYVALKCHNEKTDIGTEKYAAPFIKAHPELTALAEGYVALCHSPVRCELDIHDKNIMVRQDGSLVFTDPYWIGENVYQAYAREMQNQGMDDMYPEEKTNRYVDGGKLPKKPKPDKITPPNEMDDLPF